MELQFRVSAIAALNSYAAHYAEAFSVLYQDSGLWNEAAIIEGYREGAKKIRNDILVHIQAHLTKQRVLGRKRIRHGWEDIRFRVGSRLIIIHYSEDRKENIRWVESVSINRKPIIF